MTLGDRLKARRKALDLSVDELAAKIGKDRSTIYRYERGDIENMPVDLMTPIAQALETTPQYLMGWVDEEAQPSDEPEELSEAKQNLIQLVIDCPEEKAARLLQVLKLFLASDD